MVPRATPGPPTDLQSRAATRTTAPNHATTRPRDHRTTGPQDHRTTETERYVHSLKGGRSNHSSQGLVPRRAERAGSARVPGGVPTFGCYARRRAQMWGAPKGTPACPVPADPARSARLGTLPPTSQTRKLEKASPALKALVTRARRASALGRTATILVTAATRATATG